MVAWLRIIVNYLSQVHKLNREISIKLLKTQTKGKIDGNKDVPETHFHQRNTERSGNGD